MHLRVGRRALFAVALAPASLTLPIGAVDAQASGTQSETLLRASASWNGVPYEAYPQGAPEVTVLRITVPAHGELAWHKHGMPTAAHLVSGEMNVEDRTGRTKHFSTGQVIPETVNTWHRGVVGNTPAIFIAFYAGVKNMPLSTKQP